MLMTSMTVFDDFLLANVAVLTSQELIVALGQYDYLALQAVADNVTVNGTLTVQIQHSADGRLFGPKNGTAEIAAQTITASQTTPLYGYDGSTAPSLAFIRLSIAATVAAHVRIMVTARDSGGGDGSF